MRTVKLEEVIEAMHKSYIEWQFRFVPIKFYKTRDRLHQYESEEYIAREVKLDHEGLKFDIMPTQEWLNMIQESKDEYEDEYDIYSIINSHNVIHTIDKQIFKDFRDIEVEKGGYDEDERHRILEEKYYDIPVLYKISYSDDDYKPIWLTHNAYHQRTITKMRFYFCVDDCEHCQYWRNECTNVESDNFGNTDIINGCQDCKEIM